MTLKKQQIDTEAAASNEQPLIEEEEKKPEDLNATIGGKQAAKNVWNLGKWIMLNALLHPIYTIVNAMVLGH